MSLRDVSKAEGYELVYQMSKAINFAGFDYRTVKQSLIDYIKLYHPESFTDFIESSELIAIIESFAYVCELLAYRFDMNAHENTIEFAQRKDMVLRLARMISYNSTRNVCASGLVKIDSISTTEKMVDSVGRQLANQVIKWNDSSNPNWKEQFLLIFNKIAQQRFGTVSPENRIQSGSVLFETYALNVEAGVIGVIPFVVPVNSNSINYELVSTEVSESGPIESRPDNEINFRVIYGDDGMGDESSYTGFFALVKQGTLYKSQHTLTSVIPNQVINVTKTGVNNTDVWLNEILNDSVAYWTDLAAYDDNTSYNSLDTRKKYVVETLDDDKIRIVFGDGDFSENPSGNFDLWYRTSDADPTYIPRSAVQSRPATFTYVDDNGRVQTINITFSLVESIQNGSQTETIEHIKLNAPKVYATQDRMVTGRDYNTYPLKAPSIKKLRTVNRTFAGDSLAKMISDPSGTYQDVKIFNNDGWLYEDLNTNLVTESVSKTPEYVIQNTLTSVLSYIDLIQYAIVFKELPQSVWRLAFNDAETAELVATFNQITSPWPVSLKFDGTDWLVERNYTNSDWDILIEKTSNEYKITSKGLQLKLESANVNFYSDNDGEKVYTVQSAEAKMDNLRLLKANTVYRNTEQMFSSEVDFRVLDTDKVVSGLYDNGLINYHKLILTTYDQSGELVPDNISQRDMFDQIYTVGELLTTTPIEVKTYLLGCDDVESDDCTFEEPSYTVVSRTGNSVTLDLNDLDVITSGTLLKWHTVFYRVSTVNVLSATQIVVTLNTDPVSAQGEFSGNVSTDFTNIVAGVKLVPRGLSSTLLYVEPTSGGTIRVKSFVYQTLSDGYFTSSDDPETVSDWVRDENESNVRRVRGTGMYNFMWTHRVPLTTLVNPSPTNIHDMMVITETHYNNMLDWVNDRLSYKPKPPTPNSLAITYSDILSKKMMSDTVIMKSGNIKILFGEKAEPELRAKFSVVRSSSTRKTDNNIKSEIAALINEYFKIDYWNFGDTFFFSELDAYIMDKMYEDIRSFALIPLYPDFVFGDLMQINSREDEILFGYVKDSDVEIVTAVTPESLGR